MEDIVNYIIDFIGVIFCYPYNIHYSWKKISDLKHSGYGEQIWVYGRDTGKKLVKEML